jgi:hypothetical protein
MSMGKGISNIVFTKNRPLQLEAYLEGLYRHLPRDLIQTYLLYKPDLFDEQYADLFRRFPDCIVTREQNFHKDFLGILGKISTRYILFGTDDEVYFDSVDFTLVDGAFERFRGNIFGFSLRLDLANIEQENERVSQVSIYGGDVYRLNWKKATGKNGKYPFALNGTIYKTELVKDIVRHVAEERPLFKRLFPRDSMRIKFLSHIISMKNFMASLETFHDPNTLEGYCYRWCKTHKLKLPNYLYFQKLCASVIQVNRVNTTTDNPVDGSCEHTVNALNEKYKQGYRFDIGAVERCKPRATHTGRKHFGLIRSESK